MTVTTWLDQLSEREQKEVRFARLYANEFGHGTDGHSRLMLIAKLAELLSFSNPIKVFNDDLVDHIAAIIYFQNPDGQKALWGNVPQDEKYPYIKTAKSILSILGYSQEIFPDAQQNV